MSAPTSTVQSVTVGRVTPSTPDPALLSTPYGKTRLELPLTSSFPFHRIYYGRVSGAGVHYNEKLRLGLLLKGRVVWQIDFQESDTDISTIEFGPGNLGVSSTQVISPQYCVESHFVDPSTSPQVTPRVLFNAPDVLVFNTRVINTSTSDYITRIYCAPLHVTQLADAVFLEVSHDDTVTSADIFWAGRVYALGCHSSITR